MTDPQILHALPDAAVLTDPTGVVLFWNDAAAKLWGWTASEMLGRPLMERFPETAREEVHTRLQQIAAGAEWEGESQGYHQDGSRFWIEGQVRPVRDDSGTITAILGLSRPLSPSRAGAIERVRNDGYAKDILNSISAHVAVLGPDGRIQDLNQAWERFAAENSPGGFPPPSTGVGVDYVALCRRASGDHVAEAGPAADGIEEVLEGRRAYFELEYPCDAPTESRWFAMHVTPLNANGGGVVVAHYDITARKQAELAVASQSRRTEMALSAAHMGVWTLDLTTGRIHWSDEVHSIVGVSHFDGTMEGWTHLVHPDDLPGMQARFNEDIERRMPFVGEFRIIRPSGEVRWLTNMAQVECAPSGEPLAVVGTVQDITGKKRSEWALTAYNQILELIAAGNDLRSILEEVVRLVEEQLPGSLCSVLIVDEANGCLRFGAGQSFPEEYNRAVDGVPIGPSSGSCGTAAFRKATVTVTDIATDPLWADYRSVALKHGLKSCVSVPILSSGNVPGREKGSVIGTFALYNRAVGGFDPLTYAVLSGAEQLVRQAVQAGTRTTSAPEEETVRIIEAAHLAGVAIERAQAEHVILESQERFRAVLDSSPLAVHLRDLDGRHIFVNRAMAELFGVPREAWTGRRPKELLPDDVAALLEQDDPEVLASDHPVDRRQSTRLPDGREVTLLVTHFLLRRPDGTPYALCGILTDITDQVEAQREFERLWLHAPDPLCVAGFDGHFKQVNPAWSRLLGWTEEELLARPYSELVHQEDRAGLAEVEQRILAGETVRGYEGRFRCRDGSFRWLSLNAIPMQENQTLYVITRDITEEKRLAEQFQQAQKMEAVGQLASGVAHDFNNLLTVINCYSQLLLDEISADSPQWADVAQVLEAGQRASELTSQLLAFSRKAIIEPKILDVNVVVESSARLLRRLIGEDVRLDTSLGRLPPVKVDPGQLEQVFMNLAVNARDAMPEGGSLSISTKPVDLVEGISAGSEMVPPGTYVQITVKDDGSGMTPDVQARIFEPFFTTKGPGKGTGLGLATAYGIVRQAGGTILVESEPGMGATFRILLPADAQAADAPATGGPSIAPRGTETVLIAEDEGGVRRIARTILEMQGYAVLCAESGREVMRIVAEYPDPIHLLLTDVVMPDFGGRVIADEVRRRRPGIGILYMSGYTDDAILRHGVESSRDAFIQKPFTPLTLARRVREVLDSSGAVLDRGE